MRLSPTLGVNWARVSIDRSHMKRRLAHSLIGATIPARKSFYAIHGDVVAFACSRSHGYGIPLSSARYAQALSDITSSCGRHIAGAQELQTNRGSPIIVGYQ
jgi:hypothetical protein